MIHFFLKLFVTQMGTFMDQVPLNSINNVIFYDCMTTYSIEVTMLASIKDLLMDFRRCTKVKVPQTQRKIKMTSC
jgi:hypothetical protein